MIQFHVTGNEIDELGRVVDFGVINRLFKGWIDDHWDHGFIVWDADENALTALEQVRPNKIYRLPYNPTAENMAQYLCEGIGPQQLKGTGCQLIKCTIEETRKCSATYEIS